ITGMRPPQMIIMALNVFGIVALPQSLFALVRNALGHLSADERQYVPEPEQARAVWTARVHVAIYLAAVVWAIVTWSWLPLLLIGLPRAYGIWLLVLMGLPQHAGLDEDVLDHRLNSRTVIMNPVLRFVYMNMNYHIEHHMFPMVPFYALPRLHEAIRH
ncbi:MAG TPA: fatty acid desaturase, partial [Alphaproteobacteria bacterium]|nr:fatty acid desaturase [Alphaproteobacteria bacterium]